MRPDVQKRGLGACVRGWVWVVLRSHSHGQSQAGPKPDPVPPLGTRGTKLGGEGLKKHRVPRGGDSMWGMAQRGTGQPRRGSPEEGHMQGQPRGGQGSPWHEGPWAEDLEIAGDLDQVLWGRGRHSEGPCVLGCRVCGFFCGFEVAEAGADFQVEI